MKAGVFYEERHLMRETSTHLNVEVGGKQGAHVETQRKEDYMDEKDAQDGDFNY